VAFETFRFIIIVLYVVDNDGVIRFGSVSHIPRIADCIPAGGAQMRHALLQSIYLTIKYLYTYSLYLQDNT
jgi:hypothetical protein